MIGSHRRSLAMLSIAAFGLLASSVADAFVPNSERTLAAVAEVNRASGRTKALQLDLTMRIADRPPVASGELISHPTGMARLELRGYSGRVDRYLLSGSELLAAKDGQKLDRPQPMLQPLFLLQPASSTTLMAALETFGVKSQWIGLAPCGDQDCFVIGDPRLATLDPSSNPARAADSLDPLAGQAGVARRSDSESDGFAEASTGMPEVLEGPTLELAEGEVYARLWVDTQDLQVRRIDRSSGVYVILGPMVKFDRLTLPAWLEIHEPGEETIRFDVDRAVQVNAPPKSFSQSWLFAPPPPTEPPAGDSNPGPASPSSPTSSRSRTPDDRSLERRPVR